MAATWLWACVAVVVLQLHAASAARHPPPRSGQALLDGLRPSSIQRQDGHIVHHFEHLDDLGVNTTFHYKLKEAPWTIFLAEHPEVIKAACASARSVTLDFNSAGSCQEFSHLLTQEGAVHSKPAVLVGHSGLACVQANGGTMVRSLHARPSVPVLARCGGSNPHLVIPSFEASLSHAFDGGFVYFRSDNLLHLRELSNPEIGPTTDMTLLRALGPFGASNAQWGQQLSVSYNYNSKTRSAQNENIQLYSSTTTDKSVTVTCTNCFAQMSVGIELSWNLRSVEDMVVARTPIPVSDATVVITTSMLANVDVAVTFAATQTFSFEHIMASIPVYSYGNIFAVAGIPVELGLTAHVALGVSVQASAQGTASFGMDVAGQMRKGVEFQLPGPSISMLSDPADMFAAKPHAAQFSVTGNIDKVTPFVKVIAEVALSVLGSANATVTGSVSATNLPSTLTFPQPACQKPSWSLIGQVDFDVSVILGIYLRDLFWRQFYANSWHVATLGPWGLRQWCATSATPPIAVDSQPTASARALADSGNGISCSGTCTSTPLQLLTPVVVNGFSVGTTAAFTDMPACGRLDAQYPAAVYRFTAPVSGNFRISVLDSSVPVAAVLRATDGQSGCCGYLKGCATNYVAGWTSSTPKPLSPFSIDVSLQATATITIIVYGLTSAESLSYTSSTLMVSPVVEYLEYFVDSNRGKDTNGGTFDASFATINKALTQMALDWISGQHLFGRIMLWPNTWQSNPTFYLKPEASFTNGIVIPSELQGRPIVFSSFSSMPGPSIMDKLEQLCAPAYSMNCLYSAATFQALYGTAWGTLFQCGPQTRAFLFSKDSNVTLSGILVYGCGQPSTTRSGGAIQITRSSVGVRIINSILYNSEARDGGAIQVSVGSSASIEGTVLWRSGLATVSGFGAMRGGCLSVTERSHVSVVGSRFQSCYVRTNMGQYSYTGSGGAIFVLDSELQLQQCTIAHAAAQMYGGAIAVMGDAAVATVSQLSILDSCAGMSGGAVFVQDATATLSEVSIQNTTSPCIFWPSSSSDASAVHVSGTAVVSITQTNITRVPAPAIVVSSGANLTLTNSFVQGHGVSSTSSTPVPSAILVQAGYLIQSGTYVADVSSNTQIVACSQLASQTGCVSCASCSGLCDDLGCDPNGYDRMCLQRVGMGSKYISSNGSCTAPNSAIPVSILHALVFSCTLALVSLLWLLM